MEFKLSFSEQPLPDEFFSGDQIESRPGIYQVLDVSDLTFLAVMPHPFNEPSAVLCISSSKGIVETALRSVWLTKHINLKLYRGPITITMKT